jgi:hypothetical protein
MNRDCEKFMEQIEGDDPVGGDQSSNLGQSETRKNSSNEQRRTPNWAWAKGNLHYDWMDHFS